MLPTNMSHDTVKSIGHGFCNAIFSSSPINFDKENTNSLNKDEVPCSMMCDTPQKGDRSKKKNKSIQQEKCKLNNDNKEENPVKGESSYTVVSHPKCNDVLQRKHVFFSENITTEESYKTLIQPSKTSSNDRTPHTQSYTPKQYKMCSALNSTKISFGPSKRTPLKRYFSDHVLSQATPDCFSVVQVETPCNKSNELGLPDQTLYDEENSNLTVGIRVRPLSAKEQSDSKIMSIVEVNGQAITVMCELTQHTFTYDHCFISYMDPSMPGHASQETVFKSMVLPLAQNAFEGYNVCLFAYGQTGSGKSYSMMGQEAAQVTGLSFDEACGIIPRFCHEIFRRACDNVNTKTIVEISYFEIYNEKIHDLLTNVNNGTKRAALKVREHPVFGPYIVDLSQHCVQNYKDLQTWLKVGNSQRATAATGMNEKSSRSHSIFSIILTQTPINNQLNSEAIDASRRSKINLVDLAGSERLSQTCASGDRLKEGVSINKSLLTLGKVIASLAENTSNRKRGFVPYRESVLTWLLKESLGGNSKTAMLGTVSPANIHVEETLATLRYACQARAIVNRVRINEDAHEKLIRELKAEVLRLRGVREGYEKQLGVVPRRLLDSIESIDRSKDEIKQKQEEIDKLKDRLKKTEEQLSITQMTWQKKLCESEEKKNSELKYLRRCGIAIEIDFQEQDKKHPCLVNLAADPMLSGTLLYLIPEGLVRIGRNSDRQRSSENLDIMLDGPLVRPLHCTIENNNGKLVLSSEMEGDTFVNGQVVTGKVTLKHGDRLVIGGNHYFKVSNPRDQHSNIKISTQTVDYEFAHQEILKVQEERLRAELEESKRKAVKELENAKRDIEMQLGSQKISYERKIEILGSTVEEQKQALAEIQEKKLKLELEKQLLESEVKTNNRLKEIQLDERKVTVEPYKSNFLQELESILNEKTADAEFALKMKISSDAITSGGISLHEMQLLVKEATERCRQVGINYEFDQQQVIVNKSLRPVIRIRNKESMKETLWQPLRFLDWVHRLRDYDIEDSIKELCASDEAWESYENTETFEDSLNSSRISINMTPVKKYLNESLQQLPLDTSIFSNTLVTQTFDSSKNQETINTCLIQIELATKTLYKLCSSRKDTQSAMESLNNMQSIINNLRDILDVKDLSECANESTEIVQNCTDNNISDISGDTTSVLPNVSSNSTIEACNINSASLTKAVLSNDVKVSDKKTVRFIDKIKQKKT